MAISPLTSTWVVDGANVNKASWRAWGLSVESSIAALEVAGGGPNLLINGDFRINQRAFAGGALADGVYGFDRWKAVGASNISFTAATYNLTINSGAVLQVVEPAAHGYANLAGRQVTVSHEGASGSALSVAVGSVSGTIPAGSGRRSVTLTLGAGDTGDLNVILTPAAYPYDLNRVKLEAAAAATAWQPRPLTLELALCQRYFQRYANTTGAVAVVLLCYGYSSGRVFGTLLLPVPMRATPTFTFVGASVSTIATTIGAVTTASVYSTGSTQSMTLDIFHNGTSAGNTAYTLVLAGGSGNHITFSAEM